MSEQTEIALIKLLLAQVREYSDNESAIEYDENGKQLRSVELDSIDRWLETGDNYDLHHYNLYLDGEQVHHAPAVEYQPIDEAYYDIVGFENNNDIDHGPCQGMKLSNGWLVWLYSEKPTLISFHYEGVTDE